MHIHNKTARQTTHVRQDQAQLFALLAQQLIDARKRLPLEEFKSTPEYDRFLIAGYACGFVCGNLKPLDAARFTQALQRPMEHLADCSFRNLRHWIHQLFRQERQDDGYSSSILTAIDNGALGLITTRLERDERLREPEIVLKDEIDESITWPN